MSWTRRLNPEFKENPENLGDGVPGYFIHILHIVPQPVPQGVTQEYQVVKILILTIDDETCEPKFETVYKLDIVDIGGRTEIPDRLGLDYRDKQYCVVWELALHTIGFGGAAEPYKEVVNKDITEAQAKRIIGEMVEPITRFTTLFVFSKGDCCKNLLRFLWGAEPRRREELRVEGLGDFPKPKPPKPLAGPAPTEPGPAPPPSPPPPPPPLVPPPPVPAPPPGSPKKGKAI